MQTVVGKKREKGRGDKGRKRPTKKKDSKKSRGIIKKRRYGKEGRGGLRRLGRIIEERVRFTRLKRGEKGKRVAHQIWGEKEGKGVEGQDTPQGANAGKRRAETRLHGVGKKEWGGRGIGLPPEPSRTDEEKNREKREKEKKSSAGTTALLSFFDKRGEGEASEKNGDQVGGLPAV